MRGIVALSRWKGERNKPVKLHYKLINLSSSSKVLWASKRPIHLLYERMSQPDGVMRKHSRNTENLPPPLIDKKVIKYKVYWELRCAKWIIWEDRYKEMLVSGREFCLFVHKTHDTCCDLDLGKPTTRHTGQFSRNQNLVLKLICFLYFILTLIISNFGCRYYKGKKFWKEEIKSF